MFGECHGHIIMDGQNYKKAISLHRPTVCKMAVQQNLKEYQKRKIHFFRDGGDALGVSKYARQIAGDYEIDYRTPIFAIHKNGHYGGIVGHGFDTMQEYSTLVKKASAEGADFIKIMTTGLLDFADGGSVTGEKLSFQEVKEMIHIAHEEGFSVMSHTNGDLAVKEAILCGVDSIEHGNYMQPDTLTLLAQSNTIWVPTLSPVYNLYGCGRFDDAVISSIMKKMADSLSEAFRLNAAVALGSDAGAYLVPHAQGLYDEYEIFSHILVDVPDLDSRLLAAEEELRSRFIRH